MSTRDIVIDAVAAAVAAAAGFAIVWVAFGMDVISSGM